MTNLEKVRAALPAGEFTADDLRPATMLYTARIRDNLRKLADAGEIVRVPGSRVNTGSFGKTPQKWRKA